MNKKDWSTLLIGVAGGAIALYLLRQQGLFSFVDRVNPNSTLIIGGGGGNH